ncbi:hypothetical protein QR680_006200 [Steinernema hermaphroditum]|uniref:Uncharacterized protein n=1 Tax=Steinernema hermaphroditum TaxID=289476 RepID=A0AA39HX27_9BILA|nr:hypothetical protein QR680_006200 [Steinernema hermaphroditum]
MAGDWTSVIESLISKDVAAILSVVGLILLEVIVMFISIPVNIIIIILSFTKVPKSLARTYILNISCVMLADVVFCFIYVMVFIKEEMNAIVREPTSSADRVLSFIQDLLRSLSINVYYFQATLTVVFSYIAFARPVLAMTVLKERTINLSFAIGYVLAVTSAAAQAITLDSRADKTAAVVLSVFRGITQLTALIVMVFFYVKALCHIFATNTESEQSKPTLRALRSMLIYSTPPNLLLIVAVPEIICGSFVDLRNSPLGTTCAYTLATASLTQNIRIFITSVCALIAFRDYRLAFVSLFTQCWRCCRRRAEVSNVTVSPLNTD